MPQNCHTGSVSYYLFQLNVAQVQCVKLNLPSVHRETILTSWKVIRDAKGQCLIQLYSDKTKAQLFSAGLNCTTGAKLKPSFKAH